MKNILPGTASLPPIEVEFGSIVFSRNQVLRIISILNRIFFRLFRN